MAIEEYTIKQKVEVDGQISLTGLPVHRGDDIEVTVRVGRKNIPERGMTVAELLASDFIGMWADREDIGDTLEFARRLRREAETRDWSDDPSAG